MSYSIIYDKQFIKVEENEVEKFVPIILVGSNNCYDHNNRRSRSWWNFTYILDGKGFGTLEELIKGAKEERERKIKENKESNAQYIADGHPGYTDEYDDSRWGYFTGLSFGGGCKATFGQYLGIYKTGCKKAVTVEELYSHTNSSVNINCGYDAEKKLEKFSKKPISFAVNTSAELVEKYREIEKFLEGTGLKPIVTLHASEEIAKRIRKRLFSLPKKEKEKIEVDHYFIVKDFVEDNYVVKSTRNGYSFSRYGKSYAKQFRLESQAKTYAKKLSLKYVGKSRFIAEPVEDSTHFWI